MSSEAMYPSTAEAYAEAHIEEVHIDDIVETAFASDAITVQPVFGVRQFAPLYPDSKKHNKGIFVLVKTSNPPLWRIPGPHVREMKLHEIIAQKPTNGERI